MLKNHSILEVVKNEKVYQLHLPSDASLGEVHDVLYQMRSFVVERIQEHMKAEVAVKDESLQEGKV